MLEINTSQLHNDFQAPQNNASEEYASTFYDAFYLKSDIATLDSLAKEKEDALLALEKVIKIWKKAR